MPKRFDVIVVGVGAMGAAACFHLAWRGVRVLGLDQFDIPNNLGSSHGFSRMIRTAYYEHPDYVPLLRRAFELWGELERESDERFFHVTGGLYMGRASDKAIAGSLASAKLHDLPHEVLDRAQLAKRFPQFNLPDDAVAMFEQSAGLLVPEKCIAVHADLARRAGAAIHPNEPVISWTKNSVTTVKGTYLADKLIFCGGAWTDKLIRDFGVKLVVTRQVLGWVEPKRPELFALGRLPVWAIGHADGSLHYGFPMLDDGRGFKLAHHVAGAPTDPDKLVREAKPDDEQTFRGFLKDFIPDADGPLRDMRICMYTNSPDKHFIIDRHPGEPSVIVACGFSGHGFKFASVIGEALADLATKDTTTLPIDFLSLKRFREGGSSPSASPA